MVKELNIHYLSLKERVYDRQGDLLTLTRVQYGAKFLAEAEELIRKHQGRPNIKESVQSVKKNGNEMLLELVTQVKQRLANNKDLFPC